MPEGAVAVQPASHVLVGQGQDVLSRKTVGAEQNQLVLVHLVGLLEEAEKASTSGRANRVLDFPFSVCSILRTLNGETGKLFLIILDRIDRISLPAANFTSSGV